MAHFEFDEVKGDFRQSFDRRHRFLYMTALFPVVVVRFVGHQKELYQNYDKSIRKYFWTENNSPQNNLSTISTSKRVVSLVIDRDNDQIKAFSCPMSVWNMVKKYDKEYDFRIERMGVGISTRYKIDPLEITEVTEIENKVIEATLHNYSLEDIFIYKEDDWNFSDEKIEAIESRFDILDL